MKRAEVTCNDPKPVIKCKLSIYFLSIRRFHPASKSPLLAEDLRLDCGVDVRRIALDGDKNVKRRLLLRCRLGTLITRNDMVRMNRIPGGTLGSCLGCGDEAEENPEHVLLDCHRHAEAREKLLGETLARLRVRSPRRWKRLALSWLLGGDCHRAVGDIVASREPAKEEFWRQIAAERQRALWSCRQNCLAQA
ncbi:hypothetical protein PAPHI01_2512 [Pancytospora philotis]|nr:hypothetical protein PAPHI01_2512 [Pancytospora philotis]